MLEVIAPCKETHFDSTDATTQRSDWELQMQILIKYVPKKINL